MNGAGAAPIVTWNAAAKTITIDIDANVTTANQVINAINNAGIPFVAALDGVSDSGNTGLGVVDISTSQGGGTPVATLANGIIGVPSFYQMPNASTGLTSATGVTAGHVAIPFTAGDSFGQIALEIQTAVQQFVLSSTNYASVAVQVSGSQLFFTGVQAAAGGEGVTANLPLAVAGQGPGGNVTGMAYVTTASGTTMLYAVSDAGGLYQISQAPFDTNAPGGGTNIMQDYNYEFQPGGGAGGDLSYVKQGLGGVGGPKMTWVSTATVLEGYQLEGLTVGPADVDGGKFAQDLFALAQNTSTGGAELVCFDTSGNLVPAFQNGQSVIQLTGLAGGASLAKCTGIAFSTLDYNLWHETDTQGAVAGHGINQTFDGTRLPNPNNANDQTVNGNTSYYFGLENPNFNQTENPNNTVSEPINSALAPLSQDQAGASNYEVTNPGIYGTVNLPGGATARWKATPRSASPVIARRTCRSSTSPTT